MLTRSIFKAYDIRGIYPSEINSEVAKSIALACTKFWHSGEIIVAHDGRHGSVEFARTFAKNVREKSNNAISAREIGFSTTPMFYFIVNNFAAVGGAMITASHNPKEYNGFKIVKENGEMVSGSEVLKFVDMSK